MSAIRAAHRSRGIRGATVDFALVSAEYVLGVDPYELPSLATSILACGEGGPKFGVLATAERDAHPEDLRILFEEALAEAGIELPDIEEATRRVIVQYARDVADDLIEPMSGALEIVLAYAGHHDRWTLGANPAFQHIVGAYYEDDLHGEYERELRDQVREECIVLAVTDGAALRPT